MLRSLHISNYVLIDSLDISFPEGLVIITGQTGAGKSILLGALSLLTGAKADAAVLSPGAESCVVEAEFFSDSPEVRAIAEESEVEWDGGSLLIRRVVYSSGRSRSFVNDSPVSLSVLSALSSHLIDIHSQHRNTELTGKAFQLSLLDDFAGSTALKAETAAAYRAWQSAETQARQLSERLSELSSRKDYNDSQWRELDKAALKEGELEELEAEQLKLAAAEQIKENLSQALEGIEPHADSIPGVSSALRQAQKLLEKTEKLVPSLSSLAERIEAARIEIEDITSSIEQECSSLDFPQDRLEKVEERLSLIYSLERKHNVHTVGELLEVKERYAKALYDTGSIEERLSELKTVISEAKTLYDNLAERLHEARSEAAPRLASQIQDSIRSLELDGALFTVDLASCEAGPTGKDSVAYRFSSTGTTPPAELAKCASGGELSRIMLCLKEMMARYEGMPTMIFDEIDTGVSGSVAHKMGRMICSMGENMQVFAITHLPQVAAKGSAHYLVEKSVTEGGMTRSGIRRIEGEERENEIARLLSGEIITPEALANARSLLNG